MKVLLSRSSAYVFHSIKEKSRLISKGMCVLLLDVFNHCSLVHQLKEKIT